MSDDNESGSMPSPSSDAERAAGLELALQLTGAMSAGLANTTNTLTDNLTHERDRLEAELAAVRGEVRALLYGQWMPTSDAILRALHPIDEIVDAYRAPKDR